MTEEDDIRMKHRLWDAGLCGEQSAERGDIMNAVRDLIREAEERGRLSAFSGEIKLEEINGKFRDHHGYIETRMMSKENLEKLYPGVKGKMSNVKLISITPDAEKLMGYCARVSSPQNQENPDSSKLLKYCIEHEHWSVFEMANMVLEIETSRAISAQILRHRSFCFQEFSQRYAAATEIVEYEARRQDVKNRQNSIDDIDADVKAWWGIQQLFLNELTLKTYERALQLGIAKECARFILPMATATRLYMNGSIRSWIHYINLRTKAGTQKEHMDLALECKRIFIEQLPETAKGLGWI